MMHYRFTQPDDHGCVVLIHGLGQDHTIFNHQVRYLTSHHYPTLAVDLSGHGQTHLRDDLSISTHAQDLDEVIQEAEIIDPTIVGFSLGAAVALEYAHQHPDKVTKVGLINPAFHDEKYTTRKVKLLQHVLPALALLAAFEDTPRDENTDLSTPKYLQALPKFIRTHAVPSLIRYLAETTSFRSLYDNLMAIEEHGIPDYLDSIKVPVHLLYSDRDELVHPKLADDLLRTIPKCTRVKIKKANHVAMLSQTNELNFALLEFLKRNLT